MKVTVILVFTLLFSGYVNAQNKNAYSKLSVGDTLPTYNLDNIINYKTSSVSISEFKGKLLILDFWASWCSACIESWPKLIELQKKYDGRIQIITINPTEGTKQVEKLIEKRREAGLVNMNLPTVCKDSIITTLFPFSSLPHIVWINAGGEVRAVTEGKDLNASNIEVALSDPRFVLNEIKERVSLNSSIPFLAQNAQLQSSTLASSSLSGYVDILPFTTDALVGSDYEWNSLSVQNRTLLDLYNFVYSPERDNFNRHIELMTFNRIELEVAHPEKFFAWTKNDELIKENLYTYQLIIKRSVNFDEIQKMAQKDLDRIFGFRAEWIMKKKQCLVFSCSDTTAIAYKEGSAKLIPSNVEIVANNVSIRDFIKAFINSGRYMESPYPIVDETGLKGNLGKLKISAVLNNYKEVDKALRKYKASLTLQEREMPVLVISEPKDSVSGFRF